MDTAIPCDGFSVTAAYTGHAYGDTWYEVSTVVTSLPEAMRAVEAMRAAVKRERPDWSADNTEPQLRGSDWRGNPVRVVLAYTRTSKCERCHREFMHESDGPNASDYVRSKTIPSVCWSCLTYNERSVEALEGNE